MASEKSTGAGLVDLETELTCSICTEILYQPLTLLDCLHTFCGSCLKEWFSWQTTRRSSGSNRDSRPTCPSCRARVRDTRHDAKVNTLLDMYLKSNPAKAKSAEEKEEIGRKYNPGEDVLSIERVPSGNTTSTDTDGEEDRRLLAEVREMSLRDTSNRRRRASPRNSGPREPRGSRARNRENEQEDSQRRRRDARQRPSSSQQRSGTDHGSRARQIEHQSSLRSLLSGSDGEAGVEEEILRQIVEEGLLDGIDLHTLDPAQEDELSERIADAYRRRYLSRSTSLQRTRSVEQDRPSNTEQRQSRSSSFNERASENARRPPVSRPHLLETSLHQASSHHRRSSSDQGARRRATSPTPRSATSSSEALIQPAARSSSDLTSSRYRSSSMARSSGYPTTPSFSSSRRDETDRRQRQGTSRSTDRPTTSRRRVGSPAASSALPRTAPPASQAPARQHSSPASSTSTQLGEHSPPAHRRDAIPTTPSSRPSSSRSEVPARSNVQLFPEPSVSCSRCGRRDIQYELHKTCTKCEGGNYHLCLRCYRLGRGCLHWFGFGPGAQARYEQSLSQPSSSQDTASMEPPHVLKSRRYFSPPNDVSRVVVDETRRMTSDNPTKRLQEGMFCDMCHSFADDCFWVCSTCNDGEWGFCNQCVNQGKCCTHALLPIARMREDEPSQTTTQNSFTLDSSPKLQSTLMSGPLLTVGADEYKSLSFSTNCNRCSYPIPPSSTRFHCPTCNDGNYDICTNCYLRLGALGRISKDNGRNGWRRCLQGHRMMVVGFEDHADGQRRVIVKDLVGGRALKDEFAGSVGNSNSASSPESPTGPPHPPSRQDSGDWCWQDNTDPGAVNTLSHRKKINRSRHPWTSSPTSSPTDPSPLPSPPRFPPSGGIGLRLFAIWSYYPEPEVTDEIMFPRGAEITEAENINDDWWWGCYAGQKGLFPGPYARVIGEVGLN